MQTNLVVDASEIQPAQPKSPIYGTETNRHATRKKKVDLHHKLASPHRGAYSEKFSNPKPK